MLTCHCMKQLEGNVIHSILPEVHPGITKTHRQRKYSAKLIEHYQRQCRNISSEMPQIQQLVDGKHLHKL